MKALDFEYDGILLSEMGYVLCSFDGAQQDVVQNGQTITFNTIPMNSGKIFSLASTQYDEALTATFQICKNPCSASDTKEMFLTYDDLRVLSRWLNRKEFKKFKLLNRGNEFDNTYVEGSFNLSAVKMGDNIVGIELELITNRPFSLQEPITIKKTLSANQKFRVENAQDEFGSTDVKMKITIKQNGNFILTNMSDPENVVVIPSCAENEVITLDNPIITTNLRSHDLTRLGESFNFTFPKLVCSYGNNMNVFIPSLPCIIEMTYSPAIKVGL